MDELCRGEEPDLARVRHRCENRYGPGRPEQMYGRDWAYEWICDAKAEQPLAA